MANIHISLDEVKQAADELRSLNAAMFEELSDMQKEMNLLDASWISDSSQEIRARFHLLANRFESERERIDEYARFLNLTVESYESLESSITSNASGMQY